MLIKLDENIPHRLISSLSDLGHDVDTVDGEGWQAQTTSQCSQLDRLQVGS